LLEENELRRATARRLEKARRRTAQPHTKCDSAGAAAPQALRARPPAPRQLLPQRDGGGARVAPVLAAAVAPVEASSYSASFAWSAPLGFPATDTG
jgi:hypothetical protein